MAHEYATRPRNPRATNPAHNGMGLPVNSPQYFEAVRNLLEMYAKDYGLQYDRNEELITATDAANISKVTPQDYNYASRVLAGNPANGLRHRAVGPRYA
jgi:hypothetical protein